MKITIRYFGQVCDVVRLQVENLDVDEGITLAELQFLLRKRYETWDPSICRLAVNQVLENGGTVLRAGDEVAVLPPYAGG
ncbi:MAG: MoaD/ThiS family protein [Flavobacteriales bacterium]|nr:MoaD/ThiS family protein [Flavobacteriales bacterium]MCB9447297.1 MoaD/ThiS family protein [Flavobacteriales bacterium]